MLDSFSMGGMVALKEFYLDENLEWDVTIYEEWNSFLAKGEITNDELAEVIKGNGTIKSVSHGDGPEFTALRNQLEDLGHITCQRNWINGDRVITPFIFNGVKFERDRQFSCGAALKHHLEFLKKRKE